MIARIVRVLLAVVMYVGGGLYHLFLIATGQHDLYYAFDEMALIPFYETAWEAVVEPAVPWIVVPVILFEVALGVAMLGRGRPERVAQGAAALWNVLLAPFGWWGFVNLGLATVHVWLATRKADVKPWSATVPRRGGAHGPG